jgi:hypothetical protein
MGKTEGQAKVKLSLLLILLIELICHSCWDIYSKQKSRDRSFLYSMFAHCSPHAHTPPPLTHSLSLPTLWLDKSLLGPKLTSHSKVLYL